MQKILLPTFLLAFWCTIVFLCVACVGKPKQDVACYSGGILIWKGSPQKVSIDNDNCLVGRDSNNAAFRVCGASCFFSEHELVIMPPQVSEQSTKAPYGLYIEKPGEK